MITTRRLFASSFYNILGLGLTTILVIVATPLLIHSMGVEMYGLWVLMNSVLSFAGLLNIGLGSAAVKFVAEYQAADDHEAISQVMTTIIALYGTLGSIGGITLMLLAPRLTSLFKVSDGVQLMGQTAIQVAAPGLLFTLLSQAFLGVLLAFLRYAWVNFIRVGQRILLTTGAVVISLLGGTIIYIVSWSVVVGLISLLASAAFTWKLLKHVRLRPNWYWPRVKQVLRFSVFSWFSDLGSALFSQADRILVGIYLGPALAGQYAVCTSVASKITQSAGALSHVLAPTASALQATQDRERVMRILRRGTRLLAVTVLCIGALAFYWSEIGLRVWLGQEFADQNTLPLRLIIVAYALFSLNATGFYVANGLGLPHVSASGAVAGALTTLLLISVIVPHLGLVGAAIGNFGYIASLGIFGFVVRYLRHSVQVEVWASFGAPMLVFLSAVAAMPLIGTDGLKPVVLSAITIMAFLGLTVCSERTAVRKIVTQGFSRWTIAQ